MNDEIETKYCEICNGQLLFSTGECLNCLYIIPAINRLNETLKRLGLT